VDIHVSLIGRKDLSGEIYRQLRRSMLDGQLRPGDPLPPTRELARGLSVSRTTVTAAYERLWGEGFVTSRVGSGTYVSDHVPAKRYGDGEGPAKSPLRPRPVWGSFSLPTAFKRPAEFDFRTGLPDASLFPFETWRRWMAEEFRAEAVGKGIYGHAAGHLGLREAIARHIAISRGVLGSPEDMVITNGTQQALDIIARVLLAPGDCIAVEDPGYSPPQHLFESLGLDVQGVPVDRRGLVVEQLSPSVRLVYVTPSHQYPLGVSMSLQRRLALLAWAEEHDAAIIEDDYDSEFRFGGRPIEPLQTLDTGGRVVYVGSFSKTMLPTLRLGFILTPPSLRDAMHRAKYVTDWHTELPLQGALARLIDDGGFARHIRRLRSIYEKRHDLISDILSRDFCDHLEVIPSAAGLHITALARAASANRMDVVLRRASGLGVEVHDLSRIAAGTSVPPGVMLGYGAISTSRIEEGLRRLQQSFDA
jgi:GntR family transcriptional regulator / MocR family aminotransferase